MHDRDDKELRRAEKRRVLRRALLQARLVQVMMTVLLLPVTANVVLFTLSSSWRPGVLELAIPIAVFCFGILLVWFAGRLMVSRARDFYLGVTDCPNCGYDLRGLLREHGPPKCPECGTVTPWT